MGLNNCQCYGRKRQTYLKMMLGIVQASLFVGDDTLHQPGTYRKPYRRGGARRQPSCRVLCSNESKQSHLVRVRTPVNIDANSCQHRSHRHWCRVATSFHVRDSPTNLCRQHRGPPEPRHGPKTSHQHEHLTCGFQGPTQVQGGYQKSCSEGSFCLRYTMLDYTIL